MTERQRPAQRNQDLWDRIWRDKRGNIVIYQNPNRWLIGWVVFTIASFLTNGTAATVLDYIGAVILAIWAVLEVWKGADYFRKALGVCVLVLIVASLFKVGY